MRKVAWILVPILLICLTTSFFFSIESLMPQKVQIIGAQSNRLQVSGPTYMTVIESADPLELGGTEMIAIAGVADPSGIAQVWLLFEGANHSMTDAGGGNWVYNNWTPSSFGILPYTIYMQSNAGEWNATDGAIMVIDTTPPTYSSVNERYDPIQFGWPYPEAIMIRDVADLSGIQTVKLEFEDSNYTMTYHNMGSYTEWTRDNLYPTNVGILSYTIYVEDNRNNILVVSGSIHVLDLMAPGSSDPTQDEWPMFHGQLNHTGEAHTSLINPIIPFSNYQTGAPVYSSPAIVGGRLYVGSYDSNVYCLNATTGGLLWSYLTGFIIESSPAVAGGRVYVGCDDNKLYCLNATTGVHLWNYSTDGIVYSSPAVADGRVFIGDFTGRVYCLNATTGRQLWNYTTIYEEIWSSPAVAGGCVYICASYSIGNIYCLNATTGEFLWSYATNNPIYSSPAVVTLSGVRLVFIGAGYQLLCLNAITGGRSWTYTAEDFITSSPTVVGDRLYVASDDGVVHCVKLGGVGTRIWTYKIGGAVYSSPAVVGGRLYVGSYDSKVYCLNPTTGALFYSYPVGGSVYSSPAVAGGRVYVGCNDGKVYGPTPPIYAAVIESANPLELGAMETITISGVTSISGIQTVLLEFEGSNQTMIDLGGGTWCYTTWTPSSAGVYPYKIYIQDNLGFWNTTVGAIQVIDSTPPAYLSVIESADPVELGGTEMIALAGVADLSSIQVVLLEFEGSNHTMTNVGSGTWRYDTWVPTSTGAYQYTIYIQDGTGNWNTISGAIQVNKTTVPPSFDPLIWILVFALLGTVVLTFILYLSLNKKIRNLSQPKSITSPDDKLTGSSEPKKGPLKLPDEPKKPKSTTPPDDKLTGSSEPKKGPPKLSDEPKKPKSTTPSNDKLTGSSEPKKKPPKPTDESKKPQSKTAPVSNK